MTMEHIQFIRCDKCGLTYELRWQTDEKLMLSKVPCALICVKCENAVLSAGLVRYLKSAVE